MLKLIFLVLLATTTGTVKQAVAMEHVSYYFFDKAKVNYQDEEEGKTTLHRIIEKAKKTGDLKRYRDVIKYLLRAGANTFIKDNQGYTPLDLFKNVQAVEAFIGNIRAEIFAENQAHNTEATQQERDELLAETERRWLERAQREYTKTLNKRFMVLNK